jgi:hypothetical protein
MINEHFWAAQMEELNIVFPTQPLSKVGVAFCGALVRKERPGQASHGLYENLITPGVTLPPFHWDFCPCPSF